MEIKKILVPLGGSIYSLNALRYAVLFAKKFGAELLGIHIQDIRFLEGPWFHTAEGHLLSEPYFELKESTETALRVRGEKVKEHFLSACRQDGVSHAFKIIKGFPSDVIVEQAKSVDLAIMGKKGEHAQWLLRHLGSVCTRVIHHIDKPLLVVDHTQPQKVKKILLCYSGGVYAQKSLELTAYFARKGDFELSVVTIATKKTRAIQVQNEAKKFFDERSIRAHYLLTAGKVKEEIKKVVKIEEADMLITGASLHRHYEDFISFSLADSILHESNIPVLFMR